MITEPFTISLILFAVVMIVANARYFFTGSIGNSEEFFVNNRNTPWYLVSFSVASSWMYVFAIVMTAFFAYDKGPIGSFWFIAPYVVVLLYFGIFAYQILNRFPQGYNLSDYIYERYKDQRIKRFYEILHLCAAIYAVTANLTGFGIIVEYTAGTLSYNNIILIMSLVVLLYTIAGGIKSSLITDLVQMISVLVVSVLVPICGYLLFDIDFFGTWAEKFPTNFWNTDLMLDPGLLMLLLFTGSILADNGMWQRVYSLGDKAKIAQTFAVGGVILLICYVGLSVLAGMAYGFELDIDNPRLSGIASSGAIFGYIGLVLFSFITLSKASSTIDTALNSAGNVMANSMLKSTGMPIMVSRLTMIAVIVIGYILASLKIDLWILITTFGVFRLLAVSPTIYALLSTKQIRTDWLFYTLVVGSIIGIIVTYFNLTDKLSLSLVMLCLPALVIFLQYFRRN